MGLIGPQCLELFGAKHLSVRDTVFDLVYTVTFTCVCDVNLKIFTFKPKRPRAMILCMKHHLVDLYRFCSQDAPWMPQAIDICTLVVVRSGGRGLGNLFTAVGNHVAPSQRRGGDMIRHSREQVSKSPAT